MPAMLAATRNQHCRHNRQHCQTLTPATASGT